MQKVLFLSWTLFFIPLKAVSQPRCKQVFRPSLQTDIFKFVEESAKKDASSSHKQKTKKTLPKVGLLKEKRDLIQYFRTSDIGNLRLSLTLYPQLKNLRWTREEFPNFFKQMSVVDYQWCPKGWGLSQLAAYFKKPEVLSLFLNSDVNIRTKKKQGGESLEDNALHISLKRNFKEGIDIILKHKKPERFGKVRSRFIDEKSYDKKTPWFLAIRRDVKYKNTLFTNLIGQREPSGYVQSYVIGRGARDGFEVASSTRDNQFITLAHRYLQISQNYGEYKELKQMYGKSTKPPRLLSNHKFHRPN